MAERRSGMHTSMLALGAVATAALAGCDLFLDGGGDGVVVLTDRGDVVAYAGDGSSTLWSTSGSSAGHGDLRVADGAVFWSGDGSAVVALDAASGDELWSADLGGAATGQLAVLGGRLFAQTADEVVCLDTDSGAVQWSEPYDGRSGAMVAGDGALFVAGDPVRRLAVDSGAEEGSFHIGDSAVAAIAFGGGRVMVGGRFEVVALTPDGLDEDWSFPFDDTSATGVLVDGADVWVTTDNNGVYGLAAADGGETLQALDGWALDPPALADGWLYLAESFGEVVRVDPADGAVDWSWPSSEDHRGGLEVVGGTLLLADGNALVGIDAGSGTAEWEQSPGGTIVALSQL